jgi:hypothetical protein
VDIEALLAHGEAAELVQQGEGLLDDVAQPADSFHAAGLGLGMIDSVPCSWQAWRQACCCRPYRPAVRRSGVVAGPGGRRWVVSRRASRGRA